MSSNEEDINDEDGQEISQNKKRRIQRACDVCRRKKSDGVQMPGNRCSNCLAYKLDCTYVETARKRGPPKALVCILYRQFSYVESLETRLEKMEGLIRRLMPDIDLTKELELGANSTTESAIHAIRKWDKTHDFSPPQNSDDNLHLEIADDLRRLRLDSRFFGKSSDAMLVKTAIDLKHEFTGREADRNPMVDPGARRPQFWRTLPWEDVVSDSPGPVYDFPDLDLLGKLVDIYFTDVNIYLPLLHRPTFERSIREKLHYQDGMFAAIVLLVCAVASRFVDDPRVLLEGVNSRHSSGWKYFDKVQGLRKSSLSTPTLYDLQFYALSIQFLQGSSAPQSCWTMVGIGIRLAQDVGAHRRKPMKVSTVEDELWKRAFWVLVCMDRMFSTGLGRPCAIQDEDYDADLPVECDDEYWENPDPELAFKQPPGKPSTISSFNTYIKLNVLLSMALRTIYAINKSKILLGFGGSQWEQHIVAELDSALNQWVDSVPDHLRWDPNRENIIFFNQSAMLYTHYYLVQILVHRPFIPSPRKPSPLSFPSLAICTNAARSASHVIDVQRRRNGFLDPSAMISVFTAGVVLLLNIWGGRRSGLSTDPNKEMADVYKCMQALKVSEERYHHAGRLWDILYELASVGELPLPSPINTNKREREDVPATGSSDSSPPLRFSDALPPEPRTTAGSRRVSAAHNGAPKNAYSTAPSVAQIENRVVDETPPLSLPMYSNELGRLPLHGQLEFSARPLPAAQPMDWYNPQPGPVEPSAPEVPGMTMNPHFVQPRFYDYSFGSGRPTADHQSVPAVPYRSAFPVNGTEGPGSSSLPGHPRHPRPDQVISNPYPTINELNFPMSMDSDTFAMWSNTPSGFELDGWGTYLTNVSELTQTMNREQQLAL
ncbi:fungal-specific transcription factor domain-containing protein [Rhodocollybia butyracea]|uniref:Fungal-specific transcription factor domain-containing protein n=1 Tax=Rhodocollybia butyracea TaxID=206335 RepID=A0A9P5PM22_9AGAR|nr:fungal-specific transcription factor domain-containing protein [Rhodocollybia butyracea]